MRLFVAGGAGFIGSNFIRWVLRAHPDVAVTNYDKLTYAGNLASLHDVADLDRYRFVHGDVADRALVRSALTGHDAVVNFAAESHVDRSIDSAAEFLESNVLGTGTLFEVARELEIPRVLHISTDEVYGSIAAPGSAHEDAPLQPNSPYAASKAGADLLARAARITYDYPITVSRTTNNFGPYHFPEKVIPLFVTNLLDGMSVPLYGDGANVRDWLYVGDNVRAQWLVLTEGTPGEIYNVGAGNEMSNLELTHRILERCGADESMIAYVADRPGHDLRYSVDTEKIAALGWRPEYSFEEALDQTVDWYRTNQWWWRPLRGHTLVTSGG